MTSLLRAGCCEPPGADPLIRCIAPALAWCPAAQRAELARPPIETKDVEPTLAEERATEQEDSAFGDIEKSKAVLNDTELHDILDELVPSGAIIE